MKTNQLFLGVLLPSRALSHSTTLITRSLRNSKSALLKSRLLSLLCTLLVALWIMNSTISWSCNKAVLELQVAHQLLLICENKIPHITFPYCLLYHLKEEIIIKALQELSGLLMPCMLFLQQILGWLKFPTKTNHLFSGEVMCWEPIH